MVPQFNVRACDDRTRLRNVNINYTTSAIPQSRLQHERCGFFGQHKDVDAEHPSPATVRKASSRAVSRPTVGGAVLGRNSGSADYAAGGFSGARFQAAIDEHQEQHQRYTPHTTHICETVNSPRSVFACSTDTSVQITHKREWNCRFPHRHRRL